MQTATVSQKFPDYGPLNITDLHLFLQEAKVDFLHSWGKKVEQTVSLYEFEILCNIGSGAFGKVVLAKYTPTGTKYAMKTMAKQQIMKYGQLGHAKSEKDVLQAINFPFVVHLEYFFIDNCLLYFVMPFISGGELFRHLQKFGRFEEQWVRFYTAQVILGLEYLHFLDIIYRDLKPENILIDHTGYLKIADFGFAKIVKGRTYTLCGTPEYIAPEIITNRGYGKAVDWWSLGVLLYEMAAGRAPFYHRQQMKMYEMAAALKYTMPKHFSPEIKDLIKNILQTDLSKRFGNLKNGVEDIKSHLWFRSTAWNTIYNRNMKAPYIPDEVNFDESSDILGVELPSSKENLFQQEFINF
uniref:Protein kinase domain-containing protein n=1 Tax=Clastoptera arizonana TaxID=38151 RepID=A0A1B6E400_9HEMI